MKHRVLVVCLLLAACGAPPKPELSNDTCAFKVHKLQHRGSTYDCGALRTTYEHDGGGALDVEVPYLLFRRDAGKSANRVTVFLSGGPGQSWANLGLENIDPSDVSAWPTDLLFVEQRGAGKSTPLLDCPFHGVPQGDAFFRGCDEHIKTMEIPVAGFNTVELAYDVENLRALLGYEHMTLSGVSYGTRWGLEILRVSSGHVDGALLDSVVSSGVPPFSQEASAQDAALKAFFDACNKSADCQALCDANERCHATGSVRAAFIETLQTLANGKALKTNLAPDEAFSWLLSELEYSVSGTPTFVIDLHDKVMSNTLPKFRHGDSKDVIAWGQYFSVNCSDNQFVTDEMIDADLATVTEAWRAYVPNTHEILSWCKRWPYKKRDKLEPVTSTVPTLLLAGTFDYRTPVAWAQSAAHDLARSKLLIVDGSTHQVGGRYDCIDSVVHSFYAKLRLPGDVDCVPEIHPTFVSDVAPTRALEDYVIPYVRVPVRARRTPRW